MAEKWSCDGGVAFIPMTIFNNKNLPTISEYFLIILSIALINGNNKVFLKKVIAINGGDVQPCCMKFRLIGLRFNKNNEE